MTGVNPAFRRSSILVCMDSYRDGVPEGRFYTPMQTQETFDSLTQFLLKMESALDEELFPQSDTARRTFLADRSVPVSRISKLQIRRGQKATFELQIVFRQHSSWQGVIRWLDRQREESFRSVLELILLMDSALREEEGSEAV